MQAERWALDVKQEFEHVSQLGRLRPAVSAGAHREFQEKPRATFG